MRGRLLSAMLVVAAVAVAGFGVPLALSVQALYRDEALLVLSEEAARAAVAVPGSFARDRDDPELPDAAADVAVALYGGDGRRLQGSGPERADVIVEAALRNGTAQRDRARLVVSFPISDEEIVVGAIRTSIPAGVVAGRIHRTWATMAALASGVLAAAGLLAARRSRSLARPLAHLRADAEVLGTGGEAPPWPGTGVVEIDAVHAALAEAATRLNAAMARERAFSADLAHQVRTPLASLRLRLETEQLGVNHDPALVGDALADVDRLEQTVDDLLALARDTAPTREPRPLATLLREAADRWEPRLTVVGRRLEVSIEAHLPWVNASPAAVRQILDVLIDNALVHGAGDVALSGSRVGDGAVVAVTDHGLATLDAAEIFIRRNPAATGEGIGLALARRLAEAEDIRLLLVDPGPGVIFHLVFGGPGPARALGAQERPTTAEAGPPWSP